jgi:hypothetical protein
MAEKQREIVKRGYELGNDNLRPTSCHQSVTPDQAQALTRSRPK